MNKELRGQSIYYGGLFFIEEGDNLLLSFPKPAKIFDEVKNLGGLSGIHGREAITRFLDSLPAGRQAACAGMTKIKNDSISNQKTKYSHYSRLLPVF